MVLRGGFGIGYNGLDQAISLNGRSNPPFLSAAGNLTGSQIVYGVGSFPADVQCVLGVRVQPGDDRQLRPGHQPAGAGPELRAGLRSPAFRPNGRPPTRIATRRT